MVGSVLGGGGGGGARVARVAGEVDADTRPLDFRLILRLFRYTKPYARKRNWLAVIVTVRSIQLPLLALLVGWIMRGPVSGHNLWGLPLSAEGVGLVWAVIAYAALAAFTQFTMHFRSRLAMELGENVVHDLRNAMFAKLQVMPMSFFERMKVGRLISRFTSDVDSVRAGVQEVFFIGIVNGGQMLVAAIAMAWLNWVLFLLVAGLAPVIWLMNRAFAGRFAKVHRDVQESYSRVTASIAESVSGIRVTQGFVRQDVNAHMFADLISSHSEMNVNVSRANAQYTPLLQLNNQFFIASLLIVGGYWALGDTPGLKPGDLIVFFFLANVFFQPIQVIGTLYTQALGAMAGAERLFRLLDSEPDWCDPPDAQTLPPIRGQVELRDVTFAYVAGRPVLHEVSFTAAPGEVIALVGHTGCGKSTIINLISKFYLPTQGAVLMDGHDTRLVSSESLHRQMGIVLQVNFLFTGTVMDNIKVGKPDATDAQVIDAARKLGCLDLFEALPQGLYTVVGERGAGLSLGQRQLVCFTRAMLADPRILILDEATSSVDTMTEARIQRSLEVLFQDRTCFVVAHRLSTIRNATRVLVLDHGRIIERGSHEQLLATGGVYANLYRQFIRATEA